MFRMHAILCRKVWDLKIKSKVSAFENHVLYSALTNNKHQREIEKVEKITNIVLTSLNSPSHSKKDDINIREC